MNLREIVQLAKAEDWQIQILIEPHGRNKQGQDTAYIDIMINYDRGERSCRRVIPMDSVIHQEDNPFVSFTSGGTSEIIEFNINKMIQEIAEQRRRAIESEAERQEKLNNLKERSNLTLIKASQNDTVTGDSEKDKAEADPTEK